MQMEEMEEKGNMEEMEMKDLKEKEEFLELLLIPQVWEENRSV